MLYLSIIIINQKLAATVQYGIKKMKTLLSTSNVESLVGKTIEWNAPAYHANEPYKGTCVIKSVDLEKNNPLEVEVITGDNLAYAKVNWWSSNDKSNSAFFFSDEDRYVTFTIK